MTSGEFLIRRIDGDWFDLNVSDYERVLRPSSFESRSVAPDYGHHAIQTKGVELSFTYEEPGFQVVVEEGEMDKNKLRKILSEILESLESATGQKGEIVEL